MTAPGLTRRDFIRVSLLASGALLIEACTRSAGVADTTTASTTTTTTTTAATTTTTNATTTTEVSADPDAVFAPGVRLRIDATGAVTVTAHRTEMGQGILTAMAMIAAEELDADWTTVTVEQADADGIYGSQVTGGSTSISDTFSLMRRAGLEARQRLIGAAAARWGVDAGECITDNGMVRHEPSGRSVGYGALVEDAAAGRTGTPPTLQPKDPADYHIVGTPVPLLHSGAVVDGSAVYGGDVALPDMRVAALSYPPGIGGSVASFDPRAALAVPGVEGVVEINAGIAVIAADTWSALRGREALRVDWTEGPGVDAAALRAEFLARHPDATVYDHPFYAHLPIEPMCCVVDLHPDACEVWAPVQDPAAAKQITAAVTGLGTGAIRLHVPPAGGRFGRGLHPDYVEHAVEVAVLAGVPVKLIWTREDDLRRDFFHPLAVVAVTADPADPFGTIRLDLDRAIGAGVPTGNWRSVRNFTEAFAHESFVDEAAAAAGIDPVEARLSMLDDRGAATVRLAADRSGWGGPLPPGWGRGIAYHATWSVTRVAQVAEVSVENGAIRVHRVVCAVDCGLVVNPDTVRAQIEGGVAFGLSAALLPGIDVVAGRVVPSNFHDAPILRNDAMPIVEVHIVVSDEPPSGIGEMGVPPIAPAVANAVFAATGQRLRSLPLHLDDAAA